jgi:alkyldihydroxyacetonephosphate synthase
LQKLAKFNFEECCLMILAFEGTATEVAAKRRKVLAICRKFNGFDLGAKPGNQWYARKYDYPYLRDLLMNHGGMVDVVETSIVWSEINNFYEHVKQAIYTALATTNDSAVINKLIQQTNYAGYVGCHISHSYQNGACLYFTFAAPQWLGTELTQYLAVKTAATDAISHYGGALSHHHSIGYEHSPWLKQEITAEGIKTLASIKAALDPRNILNPGKLIPNKERN